VDDTGIEPVTPTMPNAGHNTKSWKPFVSTGLDWLASSEIDKT
jgi:hypothetical protein